MLKCCYPLRHDGLHKIAILNTHGLAPRQMDLIVNSLYGMCETNTGGITFVKWLLHGQFLDDKE